MCSACRGRDCPRPGQEAVLECLSCDGRGGECGTCGGRGRLEIDRCPKSMIPGSVWSLVVMADFARDRIWPVGGGLLDQAADFVRIAQAFWRYEDVWQSRKK